jgi:F-type H+-transporting ATPase subunit epsilon
MAKDALHLKILSPTRTVYEGDVLSVIFPGEAGSFAVYPSHAPIIASLKAGEITYCAEPNKPLTVSIKNGFVEVNSNRLTVCVEEAPAETEVKP